jgi:hypothetical protein
VRDLIPGNPVQRVRKPKLPPTQPPQPLAPETVERIRRHMLSAWSSPAGSRLGEHSTMASVATLGRTGVTRVVAPSAQPRVAEGGCRPAVDAGLAKSRRRNRRGRLTSCEPSRWLLRPAGDPEQKSMQARTCAARWLSLRGSGSGRDAAIAR